ncbi:MAG: glycogen/starch synthase [Elusimicrobia bacterium]|nr:glycogen/starch synthase [Elusimicrobiota bacterium]
MRILQAASEAFPFCKTGGLADVVGTLSQKLGSAGHDVVLFLPKYRVVESAALEGGLSHPLDIPWADGSTAVALRFMQWRSVSVQFIDSAPLFDREGLYGADGRDYPDNDLRYAVYCRAVLEGAKAMGFKPDIIHLHDWPTALIATYLKTLYAADPFFSACATVLTVHNIAYQGAFPARSFLRAGLTAADSRRARTLKGCSFLKAGLADADWLTTVSPSYAREMQTWAGGHGLQALLRRRSGRLAGILNGLDLDCWNPERDLSLAERYSLGDLSGKAACKRRFLEECGLRAEAGVPLVGMVARLDRQKGWDIAMPALTPCLRRCRFVGVGEGQPALVAAVSGWARRHDGAARFHLGYDESLAHRLYAAADILLMPSRFEPCGLGQLIAMRYGCVPVTTRTGGLRDTVAEGRNGFTAKPGDARDLGLALGRALDAYAGPSWAGLMRAGMSGDYSWDRSVRSYLDLFARAACERRAAGEAP